MKNFHPLGPLFDDHHAQLPTPLLLSTSKLRAEGTRSGAALSQGIRERTRGVFSGLKGQLLGLGAGFAGFSFLKSAVKDTEDLAVGTKRLTSLTGLSNEAASRWVSTAKVRDVQSKALNIGFITLARNIRQATQGEEKNRAQAADAAKAGKSRADVLNIMSKSAGRSADIFKELGISERELRRGDITQVLLKTSDAFKELGGGSERTAIAQALFGRQAQSLLPLLKEGSVALKEQLNLSDKYGTTLGKKQVEGTPSGIPSSRSVRPG